MRGSWVYNYYCDESCHLQKDGKRFMVLGYIAAPLHKIEQMKGELKSLRVKYKNTLEVKWTYLNEWNYPFYAKLVDWFFKKGGIRFRAIIVDKSRYIADKCDHDYNKFYYLMYYQLLFHTLDPVWHYNIYLDIKDNLSSYRTEKLKDILNVRMEIIEKIQHVRSHELDLLQLCDLFIGAIAYNLNQTEKASEAKVRFIEKLKIRTRTDLESTTSKRISKFNLFRIQMIKTYNSLLELDAFDEEERNASLMGIFKRDFVDSGNYFRQKKVLPTLSQGKNTLSIFFNHLVTMEDRLHRERIYDRNRAVRLHWIKYHLEERQPEHLQVFSVKDKVAIRTYLYDVQESYVIVLEPRGDNRYYLLTAYYLLGRNRYKIEHKLKRRLAKVY